jgi:4-amino-4-deoxy-L-arabinose transferase-like glycosyltransferase
VDLLRRLNLHPLLYFLFVFAAYICFEKLGRAPLENWDEAWYAEVTKQILKTGELITFSWNGMPWMEKPPLYMWLSALASLPFGINELSVRLTAAISGFVAIILVTVYAFKQYGLVPSLLAFSTIVLNNIFIWRTRTGNLDTLVTLLIFAVYFLILSKLKYRYPLLGIFFAAIFLTKGALVLFPFLIFVLHELLFGKKIIKRNLNGYFKLAIFLLTPIIIWLILGYSKTGVEFVRTYVLSSDQGALKFELFKTDYISYAYYSLQRRFFWVLLLGAFFAFKLIRDPKYFLLILFSFLLPFELSFSERNNNWYLLPSMPFWSILIAFGTCKFIEFFRRNKLIIAAVLLLTLYVSFKTFNENITPLMNTTSTKRQKESALEIKKLTGKNETIVRLDHLYPATAYYSDRKVLASPQEADTRSFFISRNDLVAKIKNGEIKWLVGTSKDIGDFQKQNNLRLKLIKVNDEEMIAKPT